MNWINNVVRPKLQGIWRKSEMPDNLWLKCPETGQLVFHKDLEANMFVVPGSEYHMRMSAQNRLNALFDDGEYQILASPQAPVDPLKFKDERKYTDRLKDARAKTEMDDAILAATGLLNDLPVTALVQDFRFMGGSLGAAAGAAIVHAMTTAVEKNTPFILFSASGGARMQEGILSLMQLPRTTVGVQRLRTAKLPYIVVLTNPTTGGVTASYAMLGDIHIAEPGALIGFAGPRVIEQTIREQLPQGFQRSEYLLEHGMVDMVVHRHKMRDTLSRLCRMMAREPAFKKAPGGLVDAKSATPSKDEPAPSRENIAIIDESLDNLGEAAPIIHNGEAQAAINGASGAQGAGDQISLENARNEGKVEKIEIVEPDTGNSKQPSGKRAN